MESPWLGWLHVFSDLGVWSAYVAIPCVLLYFVLRKKDIPFRTIFLLFGSFILACGTTHLMEATLFWWPAYRLAGFLKLFTAIVSWATVYALVPITPQILAMRSPQALELEITARKNAEEALRRTNDELERLVELRTAELRQALDGLRTERELLRITLASIGDAVIATDADRRVTFLNTIAEKLTGWREPDAKGRPLTEVFHIINEDSREIVDNPTRKALDRGVIVGLANHTILVSKDGAEWPIDDSAAPIRDAEGKTFGAVLVFRDVTDQRRALLANRKNQEILKLVHKIGKIGHWEWNSASDKNEWSPEIEALYGLKPGEFNGTHRAWTELIHPEDLPKAEADLLQALKTGEYLSEFRVVWPDQSIHWLETRARVFKDGNGSPQRIVGVNMDITDRKRVEEALRDAHRRKDEFLATLAHELRNPLAPIRNSIQILKMPSVDSSIANQTTEMMERQVQHLVRLVDDLMDVSRVMRGKIELRPEVIELSTIVTRAIETVAPLIEERNHQVEIDVQPRGLPLKVDTVRLCQVVGNLLTNSAKYTNPGGHIRIVSFLDGEEIVFSIQDDGIGISEDLLPDVFDLFVQADHPINQAKGGLGIGLTLVKNLIEMHGGTVEARSEGLGKGSEFTVRLPRANPLERVPPMESNGHQVRPETRKLRLLVVDDNKDAAESLAVLLRLQGHEVDMAFDGMTAVNKAGEFRPDVVFLDIGMPLMDGYEVARRLRQQDELRNVVIAAVTGWGQQEDRRRTAEAGFDQHFIKPLEPDVINHFLSQVPIRSTN